MTSPAVTARADCEGWCSLCVDMPQVRTMVAQRNTLKALLRHLRSPESLARGYACGCVGEVCIGNQQIKGQLSELGAIPALIKLLEDPQPNTQRLAAVALCNISANHEENKKLSRDAGLLDALMKLLQSTLDDSVHQAAAGCLYNHVSRDDLEMLESSGVIDLVQKGPISTNINVRLGIGPLNPCPVSPIRGERRSSKLGVAPLLPRSANSSGHRRRSQPLPEHLLLPWQEQKEEEQ
jgi:hypothetical protein